jgi:small subunit ribosomal protein S1
MRAWERVRQLQTEDATVRSGVFATNRGGALVRIEGLRGFIPGSHISTRKPKEDLVGEELPLKFLEVDEERNRLVLSHRRALVERKMNRLEVGEVVIGTVRGIKPYGAFIDIGGVSGLLHISEISHEHIDTPHSVFNVNDELKVMIIDLDAERGRISLSTKQLEPEPGDMIKNRDAVFDKAEEMAAKFREQLLAKEQGITPEAAPSSEEAPAAVEEATAEEAPAAVEEATAETEATVEEAPAAVEEAPAETEAPTEEAPAETEATAEEAPSEETEAKAEEAPSEETEAKAEEAPAETEVQNETQEEVAAAVEE